MSKNSEIWITSTLAGLIVANVYTRSLFIPLLETGVPSIVYVNDALLAFFAFVMGQWVWTLMYKWSGVSEYQRMWKVFWLLCYLIGLISISYFPFDWGIYEGLHYSLTDFFAGLFYGAQVAKVMTASKTTPLEDDDDYSSSSSVSPGDSDASEPFKKEKKKKSFAGPASKEDDSTSPRILMWAKTVGSLLALGYIVFYRNIVYTIHFGQTNQGNCTGLGLYYYPGIQVGYSFYLAVTILFIFGYLVIAADTDVVPKPTQVKKLKTEADYAYAFWFFLVFIVSIAYSTLMFVSNILLPFNILILNIGSYLEIYYAAILLAIGDWLGRIFFEFWYLTMSKNALNKLAVLCHVPLVVFFGVLAFFSGWSNVEQHTSVLYAACFFINFSTAVISTWYLDGYARVFTTAVGQTDGTRAVMWNAASCSIGTAITTGWLQSLPLVQNNLQTFYTVLFSTSIAVTGLTLLYFVVRAIMMSIRSN